MIFTETGIADKKNKAILVVLRSLDSDTHYFQTPAPETSPGHVRMDIKRGYHYFQYIDENTTRYVTIFNTDPKLEFIPSSMINHFMTKVCYQMLGIIQ